MTKGITKLRTSLSAAGHWVKNGKGHISPFSPIKFNHELGVDIPNYRNMPTKPTTISANLEVDGQSGNKLGGRTH